MGDSLKGALEIEIDDIETLPIIEQCRPLVLRGEELKRRGHARAVGILRRVEKALGICVEVDG